MATKSKKKTDQAPSPLPDLDILEAQLKRLVATLSEIKAEKPRRVPGRFKGVLVVGPRFFEPLSEDELDEFTTE